MIDYRRLAPPNSFERTPKGLFPLRRPIGLQRPGGGRHVVHQCARAWCQARIRRGGQRPAGCRFTSQDAMLVPCRPSWRFCMQSIDRRERLRRLALETIDLAKDPYYMRNHLGQIECRLCLTLHPNEGNYLAHTQVALQTCACSRQCHAAGMQHVHAADLHHSDHP